MPGFVDNGLITKSNELLECVDIQTSEWNALKLIVNEECNNCTNVMAYINGCKVGSFGAHFATRGFGGVLAENGFSNIAEFRKFDIAPIIPDRCDNGKFEEYMLENILSRILTIVIQEQF